MAEPQSADPAALSRELSAALGVLADARRALADRHLPELRQLVGALERIQATLGGLSPAERVSLQRQLLGLLDEAAKLAEGLSAEQGRIRNTLRRGGAERRADRAYRRASRL